MDIEEIENKKVKSNSVYVLINDMEMFTFDLLVLNRNGDKYMNVSTGEIYEEEDMSKYEDKVFFVDHVLSVPVFGNIQKYRHIFYRFPDMGKSKEKGISLEGLQKLAYRMIPHGYGVLSKMGITERPITIKALGKFENNLNSKIRKTIREMDKKEKRFVIKQEIDENNHTINF